MPQRGLPDRRFDLLGREEPVLPARQGLEEGKGRHHDS
jgi:hypothetical protein